jgi:hypothetical protein
MKRDGWTFEISAAALADAAKAKLQHHQGRLMHWTRARDAVMDDVRQKGISVETSMAENHYSSSVARGYEPTIVVDALFQRRLNEASQKIAEHTKKCAEYDGWVQVLSANKDRTYPLNADDYLFFFGK